MFSIWQFHSKESEAHTKYTEYLTLFFPNLKYRLYSDSGLTVVEDSILQ